MRFKIDENLPVEIADILQQAGYGAETVFSEQLTGEDDKVIAATCRKEDRAIVTLDLGFADIRAYPPKEYSGLIVFRVGRQDKPFVLGMVTKLLAALQQQDPTGKLWIVEEKHIRVRE